MKFGPRRPSLRKKLAARTSLKRVIRHSLGAKAPKGWGWLTNPKKAAYNRVYNRTTFKIGGVSQSTGRSKASSGCMLVILLGVGLLLSALTLATS